MSSFGGTIAEIQNVAVDKFTFYADAYFLSHCHSDHMVGLDLPFFQKLLEDQHKQFYASEVTCEILSRLFGWITPHLTALDFHTPTTVNLPQGQISVMPIPAGHCPGSVMFLFEFQGKNILYTGDYRIKPSDLKKIQAFYSCDILKPIYKIYLDTTFFHKDYKSFPSREDSLAVLTETVSDFFSKNHGLVILQCPAKYGYEYVYKKLFQELKMPVLISEDIYSFYCAFPDLDKCVTLNSTASRIVNIYKHNTSSQDLVIKLSAMRWNNDLIRNCGTLEERSNVKYICFSTHASFEEGVELLKFLKPNFVEPCVIPADEQKQFILQTTINEVLESIKAGCDMNPDTSPFISFNFDNLKQIKINEQNNTEDELYSSILDSPPQKKLKL